VRGGAHAGGDHDRPGVPRDDCAALEQHAGPLGVGGGDRIDLLVDRQRLTGEQRFVDLEILGHQQTGIGGHHVGSRQVDDVAGSQCGGGHRDRAFGVAGCLQPSPGGCHRRHDDAAGELVLLGEQFGGRGIGPQPLRAAGQGVHGHHATDQKGVDVAAHDRRRGRADRQDRGERIGEFGPRRRQQLAGLTCRPAQRRHHWAVGQVLEHTSPARHAGLDVQRPGPPGQPGVDDLRVQCVPGSQRLRRRVGLAQHLAGRKGPGDDRAGGRGVDRVEPAANVQPARRRLRITGDQQQPGQGGPALGEVDRRLAGLTCGGQSRQNPHRGGQIGPGDDVGAPRRCRLRIVQRDTDVGDGQRGQGVGRGEVTMQRGDQQDRAAVGPQVAHQLEQRCAARMAGGDAGGQVLGAGHMTQHHPGAGAVRDLQQRNREGVDLPADFDVADRFAVDNQVGVFEALRGGGRRPLCAQPAQSCGVGGQFVRVGLRRLLGVQQRVGDLIDPVGVPAWYVTAGVQHSAVIAAQCRAVDDDDLHPIQPAQRARVEDHLPVVGESAAQHRREGLTAHVRGLRYAGQHGAGRVFGATAGDECARGRDQRTVGGLIDIVLDRSGHRSFRGVDGGVDRSVDHDVRGFAGRGRCPIMPERLRFDAG
jgi:hypothetical protein